MGKLKDKLKGLKGKVKDTALFNKEQREFNKLSGEEKLNAIQGRDPSESAQDQRIERILSYTPGPRDDKWTQHSVQPVTSGDKNPMVNKREDTEQQ